MKILLLEDDIVLGETLEDMLKDAGYDVDLARDGEEAAELSFVNSYDIYVLDINVPKLNGFKLLEGLRDAGDDTYVIFISALSDIASITKGFRLGAADYLKKPFYPQELLLRIDARFKSLQRVIEHGSITFNPQNNEVFKDKQLLSLGDVQLPLLQLFIQNVGKTILKEEILDLMQHPSDSALRVAINKLKQTTQWKIQNIRSIGYRLETS